MYVYVHHGNCMNGCELYVLYVYQEFVLMMSFLLTSILY